ncbi:UNVERIFIED_CONTAM: hypothetical protein Sradi_5283700 [Sesamum radiatum]|uniref:Gag-pol polyprotein n=1 Tax=Sesamum radiatum TaxID=300843 RepID=A0AAW2LLQ4_SESRA
MKEAQAAKKNSRGEKCKEAREEAPSEKPRGDLRERKLPFQRVNTAYTPLTVPIAQALMAVEKKGLIARPWSWRDTPQRPKSDKFCRFHNDYGHTMEECRHLKNKIEKLIQNGYLQEYVCWERARGTGPYQKKEGDRAREVRAPSPRRPSSEGAKQTPGSKEDNNDISRKGVIRMIAGGPSGGDSHQARKSQVREAHQISIKEALDIETVEDTPIIQFGRAERSGPQTIHNDAQVITTMLANYEVGRIFIDSGSSADILFGEAYDQMQLGDVSLEKGEWEKYGEILSNSEDVMSRLSAKDKNRVWMRLPTRSLLARRAKHLKEKTQERLKALLRFNQQKNCLTLKSYPKILTKLRELALT